MPLIDSAQFARVDWRRVRFWLYAVGLASGPILVYYGLVEPEVLPLFGAFLVALLNLTPRDSYRIDG